MPIFSEIKPKTGQQINANIFYKEELKVITLSVFFIQMSWPYEFQNFSNYNCNIKKALIQVRIACKKIHL